MAIQHSPKVAEPRSSFSSRSSMAFVYGITFAFVFCTFLFIFFSPSDYSSPWFKNVFLSPLYSTPPSSPYSSHVSFSGKILGSNRSSESFSSLDKNRSLKPTSVVNLNQNQIGFSKTLQVSGENSFSREKNTTIQEFHGKVEGSDETTLRGESFPIFSENESLKTNVSNLKQDQMSFSKTVEISRENSTFQIPGKIGEDSVKGNLSLLLNVSGSLMGNRSDSGKTNEASEKQRRFELSNDCNIFDGRWVKDDQYPLYPAGSCPHIDEAFNCFLNNRPDHGYEKYRWQPNNCNIPRLNGKGMLELLRGKRLVFVGDSLNRNMWESLLCILRNSVEDKSRLFEGSGRSEFRTEGSYSFIFRDYNCSVEFFRSPFLVQEWEMPEPNGSKTETLRLDVIERSSDKYKNADIIIFNTGHWWTHEKTSRGQGYYQEGSHVYGQLNVKRAFRKALSTWARWVDSNINPKKTLVFFRGYSPNHFRRGRWNSGGQCDGEIELLDVKHLRKYPPKMRILDSVLEGMKVPVLYLNISRMTDFRKDAHPSIYRVQNLNEEERKFPLRYQDCSHWCLPGVPDSWNELLYAQLLLKQQLQQPRRA